MKKCSILLVATSVIMAGCNNSIEVAPEVENEDVTATIEQPDVLTTKGLSYSDGALKFVWEAGDQVMVYGTSTSFIFNVTEGGSDVTKLESPDFTLNDKVTYYTFSPVVGTLSEAKKTALNVSFEGQRQVANSDTKHLRLNQYACATATVENNAVNFQFKNQVSWIVYSVTFPEAVTGAKSVTISASEGTPFVLNGTLDATNAVSEKGLKTSITVGKKASELTLALGEESGNGIDLTAGETLNAFFTIHPVDLTGKTITFTVKDAEGNALSTNNFAGRVINRNACAAFKATKAIDAADDAGFRSANKKGSSINISKSIVLEGKIMSMANGTLLYMGKDATLSTSSKTATKTLSYLNAGGMIYGEGTIIAPDKADNYTAAVGLDSRNLELVIDGNLTIKGGGAGYYNGEEYHKGISPAIILYDGRLVINGGHFIGGVDSKTGEAGPTIYVYSNSIKNTAILEINGGVFESATDDASFLINKDDSSVGIVSIKIMGGTFVGFNPANNNADGPNTNYVADGYKSTKTIYNGKDAWVVTKIE